MTRSNRSAEDELKIGLLLPQSGPIGMWSLSCENCAQMAVAEINSAGGVLGRELTYTTVDAAGSPGAVAAAALDLVENQGVEAIVGMHTSDIRVRVASSLESRVPFVFTPMYEGGEKTSGVYMVGQTPEKQIGPMISWMTKQLNVKSWYLIGNRYNYPYVSNQVAKQFISDQGGKTVREVYVPFEQKNYAKFIRDIELHKPDAVFVNLIGESSVLFNRAFGCAGLGEKIVRFCGVLEENTLLGIGASNTTGIYTATGYFQNLGTDDARSFSKLYEQYFGKVSPVLNQFAVSCYEGITLLSTLAELGDSLDVEKLSRISDTSVSVFSPRGELTVKDRHLRSPIHIVKALGGLEMDHVATVGT